VIGAPHIALAAIARPTFDVPLAQATAQAAAAALKRAGCCVVGPGAALILDGAGAEAALDALAACDFDLLVLFQASFADAGMAVRLAEAGQARGAPLLLWAVHDARDGGRLRLNSLCGINLAGHALMLRGIPYDYLLAPADDPAAAAQVTALARAGRARRALRGARVGVVGEHPAGFDTCAYDAGDLACLFGVEVAPIPLGDVLDAARAAGDAERAPFLARAQAAARNLAELDPAPVAGTAGVYAALRGAAAQHGLGGMAVRCWPEFFTELGCAACGAMSLLAEEGCPAACEADVNGTVTLLLLQEIGGGPAFIADLVSIEAGDPAANGDATADPGTGVLWHCGLAPLSMADPAAEVRAALHSNRRLPLLFDFPLKPGRVTLARLHRARAGYELVVGGGEMVRAPRSFGGTSGVIRFDRPARQVLDTIMRRGLEHHLCLTYGDVRAELAAFAQLVGLPLVELT
jgi:L-fucose isomerase-like protein